MWTPRDEAIEAGLAPAAAAARADWRADEEHWTNAALEQWQHARTLPDIARDHLFRGDTMLLRWPGAAVAVRGRVVGVSDDSLAVETSDGRVDANLGVGTAIAWRVLERAVRGGGRGLTVGSFRSRLLELEADGAPVDVALGGGDVLRGRLRVGRDHVKVAAPDEEWVVALGAISWNARADVGLTDALG